MFEVSRTLSDSTTSNTTLLMAKRYSDSDITEDIQVQ